MGVFDIALDRRFAESGEIQQVDVDATDHLLIRNTQTGAVMRINVATLAAVINSAVSQADILAALSAPNGVATLDTGGKVPAAQLPSFLTGPTKVGQYTLATLPNAATYSGYLIDVTDATGGVKTCRSNGTNWLILNTSTVVS